MEENDQRDRTGSIESQDGETAVLLVNTERRRMGYGSGGETDTEQPMASSDSEPPAETREPRRRRRRRDEEVSEEERKSFRFIYKKLLDLLPAYGDDEDDEEGPDSEANKAALRFGAKQMVLLVFPVFVCMAIVVLIQLSVEETIGSSSSQLIYTPFREDSTSNAGLILLIALGNVVIVIILVVIMTIVLVCLYKYRCYKIIQGWLMTATAILLFVFSSFFFVEVLQVHGLPLDWLSFIFLIWNFGAMGVMSIHWKGPLRLQQGYLIFCSALSANIFIKYLPNWTTWILLFAISIYDLVAVLCPKGPLRVLVETAKERNENIFPSLIYSTTMIWTIGMADNGGKKTNKKSESNEGSDDNNNTGSSEEEEEDEGATERREGARDLTLQQSMAPDERRQLDREEGGAVRRRGNASDGGESTDQRQQQQQQQRRQQQQQQQEEEEEEEPRGFRLGLGDFIFYSILVGKAAHDSHGDWVVISSCFVAIIVGLCMTTIILGMVRRALPALPISIFCGLIFYFCSQYLFGPMAVVMSTAQAFI